MRHVVVSLFMGVVAWIAPANLAVASQAKLLVILPPDAQPLQVKVFTRWDNAVATLYPGTLTSAISGATQAKRNDPLARTFNETLSGFQRQSVWEDSLKRALLAGTRGADVIALSFSQTRTEYFEGKARDKLAGRAHEEGYAYVLLINEKFLGLATAYTNAPDVLVPFLNIDFQLYDANSRKELEYGVVSWGGYEGHESRKAIIDREKFERRWPSLCALVANSLVSEIANEDHLHSIAKSAGRGDEVPAIKAARKRFASLFKWNVKPATGWTTRYFFDDFVRGISPKDLALYSRMEIQFEMKPLAAAFGTEGLSVEQFVPVLQQKWAASNFGYSPLVPFADISVPEHQAFTAATPSGERAIVLLRKLGDSFIQVSTVSFRRDFEILYPARRGEIETMLRNSASRVIMDRAR
jgi:hypothetical protein